MAIMQTVYCHVTYENSKAIKVYSPVFDIHMTMRIPDELAGTLLEDACDVIIKSVATGKEFTLTVDGREIVDYVEQSALKRRFPRLDYHLLYVCGYLTGDVRVRFKGEE